MNDDAKPPTKQPRLNASTTFTDAEINGLDEITSTLLRGGDARVLARQPAMKKVLCKVVVMKEAIAAKREGRS